MSMTNGVSCLIYLIGVILSLPFALLYTFIFKSWWDIRLSQMGGFTQVVYAFGISFLSVLTLYLITGLVLFVKLRKRVKHEEEK